MPWVGKLVVRDPASRPPSLWRRRWFHLVVATGVFFAGAWMWTGQWQAAAKQAGSVALLLVIIHLALTAPSGDRHLKP